MQLGFIERRRRCLRRNGRQFERGHAKTNEAIATIPTEPPVAGGLPIPVEMPKMEQRPFRPVAATSLRLGKIYC